MKNKGFVIKVIVAISAALILVCIGVSLYLGLCSNHGSADKESHDIFFDELTTCITTDRCDFSGHPNYSKEKTQAECLNILNVIPELKQSPFPCFLYVFIFDKKLLAIVICKNMEENTITYWGLEKNPSAKDWSISVIGGCGKGIEKTILY